MFSGHHLKQGEDVEQCAQKTLGFAQDRRRAGAAQTGLFFPVSEPGIAAMSDVRDRATVDARPKAGLGEPIFEKLEERPIMKITAAVVPVRSAPFEIETHPWERLVPRR